MPPNARQTGVCLTAVRKSFQHHFSYDASMKSRRRAGRTTLALIASIGVFGALCFWVWHGRDSHSAVSQKPLLMYCAVSVKTPVEAIAREYERSTGIRIELQFGASQSLMTNALISHAGDLYLPADESYIVVARIKNLLGDETPLAIQRLVIAVKKGNPKNIHQPGDLLRPDVKLAQANPDAAASGKITREIFIKSGDWEALKQHTTVFTGTVVEAANDVKIGTVDAAFIWDAMATQYAELEVVPLDALKGAEAKLVVAVLKSSARPDESLRFAKYLASPDNGQPYFKKAGFTIVDP